MVPVPVVPEGTGTQTMQWIILASVVTGLITNAVIAILHAWKDLASQDKIHQEVKTLGAAVTTQMDKSDSRAQGFIEGKAVSPVVVEIKEPEKKPVT